MKIYRNIIFLFFLLLLSCKEEVPPPPIVDEVIEEPELEFVCDIGQTRNCTIDDNLGACKAGVKYCLGTVWTSCIQAIYPTDEICDNIDNDCNGGIDEVKPVSCVEPGFDGLYLYMDDGYFTPCSYGEFRCIDGEWSDECIDWIGGTIEVCDEVDNNCNGIIDTDINYGECGLYEEGICILGTNYCIEGELYCIDAIFPDPEVCDALDNNCNGLIDEDLSRICSTECGFGEEICEYGEWIDCNAQYPQEEICDNIDNDCDGETDEGCDCADGQMQACMMMPCGWGVQVCEDGEWGDCEGEVPEDEICNNHDDDCDGLIDEELIFSCYEGPMETVGVGECVAGEYECFEGAWGECIDQVLPSDETCDGLDNDCDGIIDNPEIVYESTDIVFVLDLSGSMCGHVTDLVDAIASYVINLAGSDHHFGLVVHGRGLGSPAMPADAWPTLIAQLTDIISFLESIDDVECTTGSTEPVLDAIYDISDPGNPFGLAWRDHATPIVIIIGDENPQTLNDILPADIAELTEICALPGCNSITNEYWTYGDPLEMFAITYPTFFVYYQIFIFGDGLRLFDINMAGDGINIALDLIFEEICVE